MFLYNYVAAITWQVTEHDPRSGNTVVRYMTSGTPIPVGVIAENASQAEDKAMASLPKPSHGKWTLTLTAVSSVPRGAE